MDRHKLELKTGPETSENHRRQATGGVDYLNLI